MIQRKKKQVSSSLETCFFNKNIGLGWSYYRFFLFFMHGLDLDHYG